MDDRLKINVSPTDQGEVREFSLDAAKAAGWSDDPGTGKAVLAPDARGAPGHEILNPMPFAPPIGYTPSPPIQELIQSMVKSEMDRLQADDEIDDILDAEDFDVPDDMPSLETIYEVVAMEPEAPNLKDTPEVSVADRAKMDAEYYELLDREKLLRRRHREAAIKKQQEEHRDLYGDPPAEGKGA